MDGGWGEGGVEIKSWLTGLCTHQLLCKKVRDDLAKPWVNGPEK